MRIPKRNNPETAASKPIEKYEDVKEDEQPIEKYEDARCIGEPIPDDEARQRWPHPYRQKTNLNDSKAESDVKEEARSSSHSYDDTMYLLPHASFTSLPADSNIDSNGSGSTISSEVGNLEADSSSCETLLDLYSGCGTMSVGLCLGADSYGLKLNSKWAEDKNKYAWENLRLNHPETKVRNKAAEDDFVNLLKELESLCNLNSFKDIDTENNDGSDDEEGSKV